MFWIPACRHSLPNAEWTGPQKCRLAHIANWAPAIIGKNVDWATLTAIQSFQIWFCSLDFFLQLTQHLKKENIVCAWKFIMRLPVGCHLSIKCRKTPNPSRSSCAENPMNNNAVRVSIFVAFLPGGSCQEWIFSHLHKTNWQVQGRVLLIQGIFLSNHEWY